MPVTQSVGKVDINGKKISKQKRPNSPPCHTSSSEDEDQVDDLLEPKEWPVTPPIQAIPLPTMPFSKAPSSFYLTTSPVSFVNLEMQSALTC